MARRKAPESVELSAADIARETASIPQSLEAEQSCLGAMLMQGEPELARDIISSAMLVVGPEHFNRELHKHIYRAIIALYVVPSPVDIVTVAEKLREEGKLEECGGAEYLHSLIEACPSSANIESYTRIVRDKADAYARFQLVEQMRALAHAGDARHGELIAAIRKLEDIDRRAALARGDASSGTMSASDLLKSTLPETPFVVPGLLPVGLTVLAGNPKIGKSWLSLGIGVAVALGGQVLGKSVEQCEALYLALEDTPRRLQGRLQHLLQREKRSVSGLHLATQWPRLDEGGAEKLDAWLGQHPRCRLVVIDTLQKFRPAQRGGSGDFYGEDYAALGAIKRVADARGVAILVVHHVRKSNGLEMGDPLEAVAGTMGITGAADGILVLRRARGQAEATLFVTGRDVDESEIAVNWDSALGQWNPLGDSDAHQLSRARREIFDVLFEMHQSGATSATPTDIAGALGHAHTGNIRKNLHEMLVGGQIRRFDRGEYALLEADLQKARDTPLKPREPEGAKTPEKAEITSNNGNKSGQYGFTEPNRARNVTVVSDVTGQNEEEDDGELVSDFGRKFERACERCGLSFGEGRKVAASFFAKFGRMELHDIGFDAHVAALRREGQLLPREAEE